MLVCSSFETSIEEKFNNRLLKKSYNCQQYYLMIILFLFRCTTGTRYFRKWCSKIRNYSWKFKFKICTSVSRIFSESSKIETTNSTAWIKVSKNMIRLNYQHKSTPIFTKKKISFVLTLTTIFFSNNRQFIKKKFKFSLLTTNSFKVQRLIIDILETIQQNVIMSSYPSNT